MTDTLAVNISGEEGTQLPTAQRGSIYNPYPGLWGLSTAPELGLVLLPLTGQVSLLRELSQLVREIDGSQDHQPLALGGLSNLLTGSNFWAVEQVRQPAKDPFPVLLDFPYDDDTPIKEVKIIK